MITCPSCNSVSFLPMTICSYCLGELLDQEIGDYLHYLITTIFTEYQIDQIQLRSKSEHLAWVKLIERLSDMKGNLEDEATLYKQGWIEIDKVIKEFIEFSKNEPLLAFSYLVLSTQQSIENCRLDLHQRYGIDLKDISTLDKTRSFSNLDGTIVEWLIAMYYLYTCMYWSGLISIFISYMQEGDNKNKDESKIFYEAVMDMLEVLYIRPIYLSMGIKSQHSIANRISIASLAGLALTTISAKFFKMDFVENGNSGSSVNTFLRNLISSSFLSWHEVEWNCHLSQMQTELKRHISKSIQMCGPQRPSESTLRSTEPWQQYLVGNDSTSRDLEEWQARERTVQEELDRLRRAANLAPREAMIFELLRKGLTQQAIAEKLRIKVGTVKSAKSHIFKKMRQAANM